MFHFHEHHHHNKYKLKGLDLVEKAKWIDIFFHLYIPVGNFELPQEALPIKSNIGYWRRGGGGHLHDWIDYRLHFQ